MQYNKLKILHHPTILFGIGVALSCLIFFFDLSLPLGVAGGIPYVATVLIGIWLPKRWYTIGLAVLGSVLTGLGYYFSEPGSVLWIVITNRVLALFAIWVTVSLLLLKKGAEEKVATLYKELEQLSYQDGLTEIANRRMFDQTLNREWGRCQRYKQPLSLIMIDIDFFKQYNDHYGHLQGDECLKQVAQALSRVSKRSIDLIARYGGEEFVLLFPETNEKQAIKMAEQCCNAVFEQQIQHKPSTISNVVTISVGVRTIIPSKDIQSSALVKFADELLYQAKKNGRNRIEYQKTQISWL